MLGVYGEYPICHPQGNLAVKHPIDRPVLHNFVNLSTIFCHGCRFQRPHDNKIPILNRIRKIVYAASLRLDQSVLYFS